MFRSLETLAGMPSSVLRGTGKLVGAIHAFIMSRDLPALLELVAKEHNEDSTETWDRFILRYLDERNPKKIAPKQMSTL
jgi:hypothetical protein